jgi:hypothetical protein
MAAFDKDEMLHRALDVIKAEECVTLEEVVLFMPCGKTTFYALGLNEVNEIKEAIEQQTIAIKKKMRRNWRNSDNATLQIAEFKLISNDSELERLNTQKVNQTINVPKPGIALYIGTNEDDQSDGDEADGKND